MSTGWIVFAILMMVGMMGGMLWMMLRMSAGAGKKGRPATDPLEILRERYARGEISEEEYQRGRRTLGESDGS